MSSVNPIFETIKSLPTVVNMQPAYGFLTQIFFGTVFTHEAEVTQIPVIKEGEAIAPIEQPDGEGILVEVDGYDLKNVCPPQINIYSVITARKMLEASPSLGNFVVEDKDTKLARVMGFQFGRLMAMVAGRVEAMAADVLVDGILSLVGKGVNQTENFSRDASHTIVRATTNRWDNASSAPMEDLELAQEDINKRSGITADEIVMENSAWNSFIAHQSVKDLFDNRRVERADMITRFMKTGARFRGTIDGFNVWTYNRTFFDPATSSVLPFLDVGRVIIGGSTAKSGAQNSVVYGGIHDVRAKNDLQSIDSSLIATSAFKHSWIDEKSGTMMVQVKSRPFTALSQANATYSIQTLG